MFYHRLLLQILLGVVLPKILFLRVQISLVPEHIRPKGLPMKDGEAEPISVVFILIFVLGCIPAS